MSLARRFGSLALVAALTVAAGTHLVRAQEARVFDGVAERVISDPVSGFAIFGFDPVSYFVEGEVRAGRSGTEWRIGATAWRFESEGNRDAFVANPEIYTPAYGGYDAEAMERGVAVVSDPHYFVVQGDRLYLFRSSEARQRFLVHHDAAGAARAWADLAPKLGH
jgi:hypothetical protein